MTFEKLVAALCKYVHTIVIENVEKRRRTLSSTTNGVS